MAVKTLSYSENKDMVLSRHFKLYEFRCKGEDTVKYSEETVAMLEKIFTMCPAVSKGIIESGYRTPEYSVSVGGFKDDAHTKGLAVDITFYDKNGAVIPPKYIACVASEIGFSGIGVMKNSIHLDTRTTENYKNGRWYGDEVNDYSLSKNGRNFYEYYSVTKAELSEKLGMAVFFTAYSGESVSIVDALKSIGEKSDYSYRELIAKENEIENYMGTAKQNTEMLSRLKSGKLIKP